MTTQQQNTDLQRSAPSKFKTPYVSGRKVLKKKKIDMLRGTSMHFLFLFAKRFIAGESLDEALPVIEKVKNSGFATTVDILGESVTEVGQAKDASDEYCALLSRLSEHYLEMNVSLKPTQLGLDISERLCYENVCKILDKAAETNAFVRIDMEGSAYTDKTLKLVEKWHEGYPGLGTVIQSMLKRSPADVENLLKNGIGIRLCKGAYKESPSIAFKDKKDVDRKFAEIAERLLGSGIYHGIATHDEKLINHIKEYAVQKGISASDFEFQMLYGIRSNLQKQLIDEGWRLRVYLPYGSHWLSYTLRRLRERKENIWFVAKNILRK